jgi:uncharacterized protein
MRSSKVEERGGRMHVSVRSFLGVVAGLLLYGADPAFSASFDCGRTRTLVEKAICDSPELSALDSQLARAYQDALSQGGRSAAHTRSAQLRWLHARNRCDNSLCLTRSYRQRIAELSGSAPALASNAVPRSSRVPPTRQAIRPQMAPAKIEEPVRQCDQVAAHPDDPEAHAAGVTDEQLNAANTIRICQAAIVEDSQSPRLQFQLARGYLKASNTESAIERLIAAAEQGHGGALAYLGDLHIAGAPGIDPDPMLAKSLLEKAVASGFAPASKLLAEFQDMTEEFAKAEAEEKAAAAQVMESLTTKSFAAYKNPGIIENIFHRRFDKITYNERWTKVYLANIADNIQAVCGTHFTSADVNSLKAEATRDHYNIGAAAVGANLLGVLTQLAQMQRDPGGSMAQAARSSNDEESIFPEAMADSSALFKQMPCGSMALSQFTRNLSAFVSNEEAPIAPRDAIMNACLKNPAPSKYKALDFCMCFGGGLDKTIVSQAHRRRLTTDFRASAIEIMGMERNKSQYRACQHGFN